MKTVERGGRFFRVCDPEWEDSCDATLSARYGGRWNPPHSFPTLYLNADVATARANALRRYEGEAFTLFDLNPTHRPHLQSVDVARCTALDALSDEGLAAVGLPVSYQMGVGHEICQPIGVAAHDRGLDGIACRSAAHIGAEELALFNQQIARKGERRVFDDWWNDETA